MVLNTTSLRSFADEMTKVAYTDDGWPADADWPVLDPMATKKTNVMRSMTRMSAVDAIPNIVGAIGGGLGADALVRAITKGRAPISTSDNVARVAAALFGAGFGSAAGSMASTAYNYSKENNEEKKRIANAVRRQEMLKWGSVVDRLSGTGAVSSVTDTLASRLPYIAGLALASNAYGGDKYISPQKKIVQGDLVAQAANLGAATLGAGGALLALKLLHRGR